MYAKHFVNELRPDVWSLVTGEKTRAMIVSEQAWASPKGHEYARDGSNKDKLLFPTKPVLQGGG